MYNFYISIGSSINLKCSYTDYYNLLLQTTLIILYLGVECHFYTYFIYFYVYIYVYNIHAYLIHLYFKENKI